MENRRRLLMAANGLLYFGPLLAGLAGFGWGLVLVFTAIFVLWLVILQPYEFPVNRAEWMSPDAWVAVSARAAVQLLFVALLFGVGRGIGGILGSVPGFPAMLPLGISFLSVPLARLIWDPWAQPAQQPAAPPAHPTLASDVRIPLDPKASAPAEPVQNPDPDKLSPP